MDSFLSKNFKVSEIACPCCGKINVDPQFIDQLQQLRNVLNKPFKINSAYRCERHNREVGGVINSYHRKGSAVDVSTKSWKSSELFMLISKSIEYGFGGIGIDRNFIHLDLRKGDAKLWVY